MQNAHFVASAPVVPAVTGSCTPSLTLREQARIEGVSPSTIHARRKRAAEAQPTAPVDLAAAVQALAMAQAQQSALLTRLLGGDAEIQVPKKAKEVKAPEEERPLEGGTLVPPEQRIRRSKRTGFVLIAAQNNSYVHTSFLGSLLNFCALQDAELMVGCLAYNKKGWAQPHRVTKHDKSLWYADALQPYLVNEPVRLADDLIWCGNLDISPTAVDPLSGFDSYTQASSGIVPHTKLSMKPMPVIKGSEPRFMFTTGCLTLANYIQKKAGQKAEFHHSYTALFVEVDSDGKWFARQLTADSEGVFQDLDTVYTPTTSYKQRVAGVVFGDVHIEKTRREIVDSIWVGAASIRATLDPVDEVYHDVPHFFCRSHHNIGDPLFTAERHYRGESSVKAELLQSAAFLAARDAEERSRKHVVPANHSDHPLKWLKDPRGHFDDENGDYWHYLNWQTRKAAKEAASENRPNDFDLFEFAVRDEVNLERTHFLRRDESLLIAGIQCGLHGDQGSNGSRASVKGFAKLGVKTVTGHGHSAWIWEGSWAVGVLELEQGYNQGPSTWSVTHCVIYQSGKRALITQRGTRWKATSRVLHGMAASSNGKPRYRVQAGRAAA